MLSRTNDMNVKLALSDAVDAIATVTCPADDAMSAESKAVIGRRVAIVRAGVRKRLQAVARAKSDLRFGNNGRCVGRRVDQTMTAGGLGRTHDHLRRDYLYQ